MKKTNQNISLIIKACKEDNRAAQKRLYRLFFSYGMSISLRYSNSKVEAEEILNDAFFKAFSKIDQFDEDYDFKKWFRTIIINTSIDYFRKHKKLKLQFSDEIISDETADNFGWDKLLYEDILKKIQLLPPSYRVVFNLFVIEGYKHHEIAEQLNISVGTSKSNLARAKQKMQALLKKRAELNSFYYGK